MNLWLKPLCAKYAVQKVSINFILKTFVFQKQKVDGADDGHKIRPFTVKSHNYLSDVGLPFLPQKVFINMS